MKDKVIEIANEVYNYLKSDVYHTNKNIDYILYDESKEEFNILASDGLEEIIELNYKKDSFTDIRIVPEWDYNIDYYIFYELESGKEIDYMSPNTHNGIWNSIKELYPDDIIYDGGLKKYINYCKINGINKEYVEQLTYIETPDIMPLFKEHDKVEAR